MFGCLWFGCLCKFVGVCVVVVMLSVGFCVYSSGFREVGASAC